MYHLAGTPTCSYAKALYRYPQTEFPYQHLRDENKRRSRDEKEYELVDTGIFLDNRFFDMEVEYAKADAEDLFIRLTITNQSDASSELHLLPSLWYRNTWSWGDRQASRPNLYLQGNSLISEAIDGLGSYELNCSEQARGFSQRMKLIRKLSGANPLFSPMSKMHFIAI
jgi:hypothetical protein